MRSQRFRDLFALFFDPRVPVLFLVGSIVLAVLGSAIYDLLITLLGAEPRTFVALILSALVIFFFLTQGFLALLRVFRGRSTIVPAVPQERRAEPHAGLIILVGLNPSGPEREIIAWHLRNRTLRHCWLIVSHEVQQSAKLGDLRQWLLEENVETRVLIVADPHQADLSYLAAQKGIAEARRRADAMPLIVDVTGATKPMTAGAALACLDAGVTMEYLVPARRPDGMPAPEQAAVPMRIDLRPGLEEPQP